MRLAVADIRLVSFAAALGALLAGSSGCKDTAPSGPVILSISPASAPAHMELPISIAGEGFSPLIVANYDDPNESTINDRFAARLGDDALIRVVFKGPTEIQAVVPSTLSAGWYPLTVIDPRGRIGRLERAFLVLGPSDGGPDGAQADGRVDGTILDAAVDGARDGKTDRNLPQDAKKADTATQKDAPNQPDLPGCPTACVNACAGGVCRLDCKNGCTCPAGRVCVTTCSTKKSCQKKINCRNAKRCDITCSGGDTCRDVDCAGATECNINCNAGDTCRTINCANATRCNVKCTSKEACAQTLVCSGGRCDIDCRASQACAAGVDCRGACACLVRGTGFPVSCPSSCTSGCRSGNRCDFCP